MTFVADVFFKEITIVGQENIPKTGPVIICGTHANQFLDAMLMNISVPRKLGFIIAAKSYHKAIVGHFAKAAHAIPVERPQDLAKTGTGQIKSITADKVIGVNTKFTEQVKPGDSLKIKDIPVDIIVKQVNSDTEVTYSAETIFEKSDAQLSYKIIPKIDQSKMYEAVWHRLRSGEGVGIFPEGGSHDRTEMLPIKAGVCIMSLGAMLEKDAQPVHIVPCGLNYYRADRFRSKVVIDFGPSYEVPKELVETYKKSKKEAISTLLAEIEKRMQSVRISAPSYSELTSLYLARKLYTPAKANLGPDEEYLLNRILAMGYQEMKDDPQVKAFFEKVKKYNKQIRALRLDDSTVKRISSQHWKNVLIFFNSLILFIITGIFALPGLLLNGPLGLLITFLSEKERKKALAGSSVKVKATDVVASKKVMSSFIIFPAASLLYTLIFRIILHYYVGFKGTALNLATLLFILFWPLYSYVMVLSADKALVNYKNLKARFVLIIFRSRLHQLQDVRKDLVKRITYFVEKNGQEILRKINESSDQYDEELFIKRKDSLEVNEALDDAFSILEEIGI